MENSDICRLCLTNRSEFVSLVKSCSQNQTVLTRIGKIIESIIEIKVNSLPNYHKICINCEVILDDFCEFKSKAIKNHSKLLELELNKKHLNDDLQEFASNDKFDSSLAVPKVERVESNDEKESILCEPTINFEHTTLNFEHTTLQPSIDTFTEDVDFGYNIEDNKPNFDHFNKINNFEQKILTDEIISDNYSEPDQQFGNINSVESTYKCTQHGCSQTFSANSIYKHHLSQHTAFGGHVLQKIPRKVESKTIRRRCVSCYHKIRKLSGALAATKKAKQVDLQCNICNKTFCLSCFVDVHSKLDKT